MCIFLSLGQWVDFYTAAASSRQQLEVAIAMIATLGLMLSMLHAMILLVKEIIPLRLGVGAPSTSENLPIDPPS